MAMPGQQLRIASCILWGLLVDVYSPSDGVVLDLLGVLVKVDVFLAFLPVAKIAATHAV